MTTRLDDTLRVRLTEILRWQPTTESELRRLAEEGGACERILRARLEHAESRLKALTEDAASSLAEVVSELHDVRELRAELDELRARLADLDVQARELRASWLAR